MFAYCGFWFGRLVLGRFVRFVFLLGFLCSGLSGLIVCHGKWQFGYGGCLTLVGFGCCLL